MSQITLSITLVLALALSATAAQKPDNYTWSERYGYKQAAFEVGGHWGFIILPPEAKQRKSMPWVWYAPTFKGQLPNDSNRWIAERLLAEGTAICGVDVGESYGNPAGRSAFTEFREFVVSKFGLAKKPSLWAQSRGGLQLFNWAAEHPDLVKRIAATYPVCDIASYPGLALAAPAYGMAEDELKAHLAEHNPIDRTYPLAKSKIPIFIIHGDSDGVVPLEANSAKFALRTEMLGGKVELLVVKGKGHAEIPEFFQRQEMVDFLLGKRKT